MTRCDRANEQCPSVQYASVSQTCILVQTVAYCIVEIKKIYGKLILPFSHKTYIKTVTSHCNNY